MEEKANYFAIIPASVRYDKRIKPLARLLYAEITALSNKYGYCWATNKYFSDLYETSEKTISRLINDLKNNNYINVSIEYDKEKHTKKRKIQLDKIVHIELDKKVPNQLDKIVQNQLDKNVPFNNTSNMNNTRMNNTSINNCHILGEFSNVKLTEDNIAKLKALYGDKFNNAIETLSSYIESSGKKYKNHYAVLGEHNWVYKKVMQNTNTETKQFKWSI